MDRNEASRIMYKHLAYFDNSANGRSAYEFIVDGMIEFTQGEIKKLNKPAVIKSLPKNMVFSDRCIGCKLLEHYKEVYNIPF